MMLAAITNHINATSASVLSSISSSLARSVPRPDTLIGVDDLIRKELSEYRDSCFGWLLKATALVVVGLGFEGAELWHEIPAIIRHWHFRRRFHFSLPEYQPPNCTKLLASVGWFLIVLGVAGEYVADSFVSRADGYVQTFDEILAADADKSVRSALNQIADLRVEEAESRDQLNMAYLRLGNSVAPRSKLLEDNKAAFIKALKPFAPQRVIVVSCGLTGSEKTEADALKDDLIDFLGKPKPNGKDGAAWTVEEFPNAATSEECTWATAPAPSGGIVLVLSDTNDVAAKHSAVMSAQKLAFTLNKLNIITRIAVDTKLDNARILSEPGSFWKTAGDDPKAIWLLVGP